MTIDLKRLREMASVHDQSVVMHPDDVIDILDRLERAEAACLAADDLQDCSYRDEKSLEYVLRAAFKTWREEI